MLLCDSNHSALLDSLHAPTQSYTTTYQPYCSHRSQLVATAGSEITARACFLFWQCTCDLVSGRLFHLSPRLVSFDAAYLQDSSCQWFAYLPGLSLHVPRRLRKVRDSNPRIVLTIAALAVRCFQPDSANLPCFYRYAALFIFSSLILPFSIHSRIS